MANLKLDFGSRHQIEKQLERLKAQMKIEKEERRRSPKRHWKSGTLGTTAAPKRDALGKGSSDGFPKYNNVKLDSMKDLKSSKPKTNKKKESSKKDNTHKDNGFDTVIEGLSLLRTNDSRKAERRPMEPSINQNYVDRDRSRCDTRKRQADEAGRCVSPRTKPKNIIGGSLLEGAYDEDASSQSFREALISWRERRERDLWNKSVERIDSSTNTFVPIERSPLQIDFSETSSLSYHERLLLDQKEEPCVEEWINVNARDDEPVVSKVDSDVSLEPIRQSLFEYEPLRFVAARAGRRNIFRHLDFDDDDVDVQDEEQSLTISEIEGSEDETEVDMQNKWNGSAPAVVISNVSPSRTQPLPRLSTSFAPRSKSPKIHFLQRSLRISPVFPERVPSPNNIANASNASNDVNGILKTNGKMPEPPSPKPRWSFKRGGIPPLTHSMSLPATNSRPVSRAISPKRQWEKPMQRVTQTRLINMMKTGNESRMEQNKQLLPALRRSEQEVEQEFEEDLSTVVPEDSLVDVDAPRIASRIGSVYRLGPNLWQPEDSLVPIATPELAMSYQDFGISDYLTTPTDVNDIEENLSLNGDFDHGLDAEPPDLLDNTPAIFDEEDLGPPSPERTASPMLLMNEDGELEVDELMKTGDGVHNAIPKPVIPPEMANDSSDTLPLLRMSSLELAKLDQQQLDRALSIKEDSGQGSGLSSPTTGSDDYEDDVKSVQALN